MKRYIVCLGTLAMFFAASARGESPLRLVAFEGGGAQRFGNEKRGYKVDYVYARGTGLDKMWTTFEHSGNSSGPLFLYVRGQDDDARAECKIRIRLNDSVVFEGSSGYAPDKWQVKSYALPTDALATSNTLTFENIETAGRVGMPPWFMVAECVIAPEGYRMNSDIKRQFRVQPAAELREFPEPLAAGQEPGFKWRGTKGWLWRPEQYLAEIPYLPKCKMNFLMNCYGSMWDIEHRKFGDPECNRWYEPLPEAKKRAYEKVVEECQKHGITFCFSINPNLSSKRFVNTGKPEDVDALWQHYAWMQGLGVQWFNISLDDIQQGIDASGQAKVVNEILRRLREKDPGAQMIFCPTFYWGDGTDDKARPYLEALARELDKDVYLFWTGNAVVGEITREAAETYRRIGGHRLFLWDNYPVNDARPTMHLGPVLDRDPDLGEVVDGYMGNPLHSQNEINRIPMFTCGDYAWNPRAYDPDRSISQAIAHLESGTKERVLLARLSELYGGMLVWQRADTGFNAVRERYVQLAAMPHNAAMVEPYVESLRSVSAEMKSLFPDRYAAARKTLDDDIRWIERERR